MDALYHFAKWNFECGNYSAASEYLYHYRTLSTHPERTIAALWGKVAADVLLQVDGGDCAASCFTLASGVVLLPRVLVLACTSCCDRPRPACAGRSCFAPTSAAPLRPPALHAPYRRRSLARAWTTC